MTLPPPPSEMESVDLAYDLNLEWVHCNRYFSQYYFFFFEFSLFTYYVHHKNTSPKQLRAVWGGNIGSIKFKSVKLWQMSLIRAKKIKKKQQRNRCYRNPHVTNSSHNSKQIPFFLTQCGHIICQICLLGSEESSHNIELDCQRSFLCPVCKNDCLIVILKEQAS